MQYTLGNDNPFTEPAAIKRLRVWIMFLSGAVAMTLWMSIEASNPGTIAQLPSILKDFGMALLTMLRDFADACAADIRNFVNHIGLR
jgi:hypothetical protein